MSRHRDFAGRNRAYSRGDGSFVSDHSESEHDPECDDYVFPRDTNKTSNDFSDYVGKQIEKSTTPPPPESHTWPIKAVVEDPIEPFQRARTPPPAVLLQKRSISEATPPPPLTRLSSRPSPQPTPPPCKGKAAKIIDREKALEIAKLRADSEEKPVLGKKVLNLVVMGHVDAGKSTLMGHLLFDLGRVSEKQMRGFERDSKQLGKASFAFAWVLDEQEEERARGVTMDVGINHFESEKTCFTLLDAPGHRDFVPNMINGASQADAAVLVVAASTGEFEAGFSAGGQTREHAVLARALGIQQLVIAVNKMDMVEFSQVRFDAIVQEMLPFLKQSDFKRSMISFVPVSGFSGENLISRSDARLGWYTGPTLLESLDCFPPQPRQLDVPVRMTICDAYSSGKSSKAIGIAGKVEVGILKKKDVVCVVPGTGLFTVNSITSHGEETECGVAGENIEVLLSPLGNDVTTIRSGDVLCPAMDPAKVVERFEAKIHTLPWLEVPIIKGTKLSLHIHCIEVDVKVTKLIQVLDKAAKRRQPRYLARKTAAVVELSVADSSGALCCDCYKNIRRLGRFTLRDRGKTVAAGLVTRLRTKRRKSHVFME